MKPTLLLAGAILLPLASALLAADKTDLNLPASPTLPAPSWLKIIDQGDNDPRLKGYRTPAGLRVEIVAEEPTVINPVGMTFADDGTPYVLEWVVSPGNDWGETPETIVYKDGSKREIATMKKPVKDHVKVLHDTKGKGVYDDTRVILEDELPSSILLHDGWIYLSGRGTVRRFKQSKPDGAYDVKEIVGRGFCGFHHHQVSGMTIGNDGWLYLSSGDNDNVVEGSDGSRATVLRTGAIFRCRPDGSKMQTFAMGFRNPYRDVAFDEVGNMFHADNDNEDGSRFTGCRLMHIPEGADFGWRLKFGAHCCVPDHVRGAVFGELPGKMAPLLKTGRGAPAGLLIYNDTRLPENYRGLLLYPDVFRKLIRAYKVQKTGATFEVVEEFEFMKSDDPLFRPCQMVTGPDGAIYVVDWRTDSGGAGRLSGDGKHGRIYRISWAGTTEQPAIALRGMDSWSKIAGLDDADLLKVLTGPEATDRWHAQRELVRRGEKNRTALLKMAGDNEQPATARVAALGVLQSMWNRDVAGLFRGLLGQSNADLRRLAADGLALNAARGDKAATAALVFRLGDADPAVRRAIALALGHIGGPGAADAIATAIGNDDGKDAYLFDGLARAAEYLGQSGLERLLAVADSGVNTETDRVVEAWLGMRTRPAAEFLPALLRNPHITSEQRAALVRSYSNYILHPPLSLEPLVEYLTSTPGDLALRSAGLEALTAGRAFTATGKDSKAIDWLLSNMNEKDPAFRLALLSAVEDGKIAKAAPAVMDILRDAARPEKERTAAAKALRALQDKSAVPALKDILADGTGGAPGLRLEAVRSLAALDVSAARETARRLLDGKDEALQTEAANILGGEAAGSRFVAQRYLDKKLPRALLPQVVAGLRKHAGRDAEAAKLLADVMKDGLSVANSPAEAARVRKLVAEKGNPQRGRTLYLNSKTLACINCHRLEGIGGNVGPDLTRIWETQSVEKLMESLLEPSKEIKEGYQSYKVATTKGKEYIGLKISQTADEVVLREQTGQDVHIPAKEIDEIAASKQSLMPDNVIAQLSYDQFIDLVAFLKDRKSQESLRGLALDFQVAGPFGDDFTKDYGPESKTELKATYPGIKVNEVVRWQPKTAGPTGLLDLRSIFDRNNASAYALTHVWSAKDQKAEMLVGAGSTVRVWLNGNLVHERTTARKAIVDDASVKVPLKPGWNTVLTKVVSAGSNHGLFLRFVGEGLRVSSNPAAERP